MRGIVPLFATVTIGVIVLCAAYRMPLAATPGQDVVGASNRAVVVELFTSEGCSSCPPADQLFIDLLRTQPIEHVTIVGLGEHVDYWDNLGCAMRSRRWRSRAASRSTTSAGSTPRTFTPRKSSSTAGRRSSAATGPQ